VKHNVSIVWRWDNEFGSNTHLGSGQVASSATANTRHLLEGQGGGRHDVCCLFPVCSASFALRFLWFMDGLSSCAYFIAVLARLRAFSGEFRENSAVQQNSIIARLANR